MFHCRKSPEAEVALRRWLGRLVSAGLVGVCLYVLSQQVKDVDLQTLWRSTQTVPAGAWALALVFTAISFRAVAGYDVMAHRQLGTKLSPGLARRSGAAAVALGQTLGAGLVTGAIARWKMRTAPTLLAASQISAVVATLFIGGWAVVLICALALWAPLPELRNAAQLALAVCVIAYLFLHRTGFVARLTERWPLLAGRNLAAVIALTAIDTGAAAAALYILLPPDVALSFPTLFTAYLLALGAGLISNAPGGVGPFEVTLFWLLPDQDLAPVLAAVVAFRVIYYAVPSLFALVYAAWRLRTAMTPRHRIMAPTPLDLRLGRSTMRSETLLMSNGQAEVLSCAIGGARIVVARTSSRLVALFDPLRSGSSCTLATLSTAARQQGLRPCIYKCTARLAAHARRSGYAVRIIAQDAICDPMQFNLTKPAARQLRRKLRKAKAHQIEARRLVGPLPIRQMAWIDAEWSARNGGARGFSMGRFDAEYLSHQRLYGAYQNGKLIAFVSFHVGERCWTLDVMRQANAAPDGTMHLLVATTLEDARDAGLPRISLAAAPIAPDPTLPVPMRLQQAVDTIAGGPGLRQFKSCFYPRWEPLYIAAPSLPAVLISAWEISRAVNRRSPPSTALHDNYEDYEFASASLP